MSYVGQVKKGSTTHLVGSTLYGTCTTAGATAAKVGTLANFDALITGVTIHLKMSHANAVANPTLNVNGTGAKPIRIYGSVAPGITADSSWNDNSVVSFTYDGSSWVMNDYQKTNSMQYKSGSVAITAAGMNNYAAGPSITLTRGNWIVVAMWSFSTGASTGARNMQVCLKRSDRTSYINQLRVNAASPAWASLVVSAVIEIKDDDAESITIAPYGSASMTSAVSTVNISALKTS